MNKKVRIFPERIIQARFIERPNRFLIRCRLGKKVISAFLPNPGRLFELLLPDRTIYLSQEAPSKDRRYLYTAIAVEREGFPIVLHTHKTNKIAESLLRNKKIPGLEEARVLRSEVRIGRNRFDFLLKEKKEELLLEVKSCTLFGEKVSMFPDAITERGRRHLLELARISEQGMRTAVLFIVHWPFAEIFMPDYHTDLEFSKTFLQVREKVQFLPVAISWEQDLSLTNTVRTLRIPWSYLEKEIEDRGSYLLILQLNQGRRISIGVLDHLLFKKGFYVYVGSAMNHLSRRMERHRRLRKRHHWHIDELRAVSQFHSILPIRSKERLECEIARSMANISEWRVEGFGSTDCGCPGHLFGFSRNPLHLEGFHKLLQYFRMERFFNKEREPHPGFSPIPLSGLFPTQDRGITRIGR